MAAKLDGAKVRWIVRQKRAGEPDGEVAAAMGVSARRVRQVWRAARESGAAPEIGRPGRPRRGASRREEELVREFFAGHASGACALERIIEARTGARMPHNATSKIMRDCGLSALQKARGKKRSWAGCERTHANSMWHADWHAIKDERWRGRWLIAFEDDASRMITGYGVFGRATSANAVSVLRAAAEKWGQPASVMADRGSQSCATGAETHRRRGATELGMFLAERGVQHMLAGVGHPQTNGKTGSFFGELKAKSWRFPSMEAFVRWLDCTKPHRSLDWDSLETPARAFRRKMPEPDAGVAGDAETGQRYRVVPPKEGAR